MIQARYAHASTRVLTVYSTHSTRAHTTHTTPLPLLHTTHPSMYPTPHRLLPGVQCVYIRCPTAACGGQHMPRGAAGMAGPHYARPHRASTPARALADSGAEDTSTAPTAPVLTTCTSQLHYERERGLLQFVPCGWVTGCGLALQLSRLVSLSYVRASLSAAARVLLAACA